ncbi:hypothetical protein ESA_03237 [Cronobacter sakazakii ATCC BAA-894]|uniref:Uncharacterized protein n=1 Tax=Cronobacter sakazakii (strain ATCC BAA-894) TaxID=290339 RepID=A7MIF9_CROS8|nr:hypothetical protein ESA_03237 [Cronobacter sakazakii ATCC BAA-894]
MLDEKFDTQPGAHFFIQGMFKKNVSLHYLFSCGTACAASCR